MKKKQDYSSLVIRTPDKINIEYTTCLLEIGKLDVELINVDKAEEKISIRKNEINLLKIELRDKVMELSYEMDEAQKEIKRKDEKEKELNPPLFEEKGTVVSEMHQ